MNTRMTDTRRVTVAIDARLVSGHHGGVEQVIIGLAHGLSGLEGPEEYVFLCHEGHSDWLSPYVSGPARIVHAKAPLKTRLKQKFPALASVRRFLRSGAATRIGPPPVPQSDGLAEALGAAVVHFPRQDGFITTVPSIFHPHDLQHIHFPEFFTDQEIAQRDLWYRTLCDQASFVSVTSQWGKRDLIESMGIDPAKIAVVPLAPALAAYTDATNAAESQLIALGISGDYVLYPAQTWPHKNHLRLVRALALLKQAGVIVPLVCTGTKNDHFPDIWREVERLGLQDQVMFLGYVSAEQLKALYSNARCMVMPTLFEAAGGFGPIAEAFLVGLPVACSNVTSLPEQVDDAALVFDPLSESDIAAAIERLWTSDSLREELAARGRANIARFSWERTARTFRAYYRLLADADLSAEDSSLLQAKSEF